MVAINKGGDCISNEYINGSSHLWWKGHEYLKMLMVPFCQNKRERLQLDIFYPEYGFAIEMQGEQHEKLEFFHRGDPNNFIKQQAGDQLKKDCL
ncbi:hypothetical protein GLOIN_2v1775267 [Rhizophagus irregularis DAOM 181602=DAOM 197198]|uniref:Uncharacterized protein n=1 Tax=Rhizophagus irregularis (strain DAOM 181602 / DAOM 197198 / MUCL 43194) TaxID=747089 RepID=A0A2P4Q070_RHIID|nr:hypothetical protein GLOIN_2v1775267 [Rhizophagus irregularis DAOM 181602=DAOM 197198]POG71034.1 hypothetical protein GLOIN_2v1775267 [Rhizophagus irregularis DAOM 181602=DAOM 197198]|eukprot:XP_025177900.1 hypothetical protein GLOIN_2v1775267 [Rhizophagus irregularis DAOM 181602=DAOM 197198]